MSPPAALGLHNPPLETSTYLKEAWPDFIAHQIVPFGALPVYLMMGNHEAVAPMTREAWLVQFADWLETPALRAQRLKDDPSDHKLHAYYHWTERNIDFISLDNSTPDQFDPDQMKWLHAVLARDESSPQIRTIVVGMHEALPGSMSRMHSMSESPPRRQKRPRSLRSAVARARFRPQTRVRSRQPLALLHGQYFRNRRLEGQSSAWLDHRHGRRPARSTCRQKPRPRSTPRPMSTAI